jgi:O-acetyl-ADP-ribose deacetylase (regulator of RNase III)
MIKFTQGNLLESEAEALVNTVNTVGVMGKGIALMFKEAFPENYRAYADACKRQEIEIGRVFATERRDWVSGPRWIINFPTKKHWRHPSKLDWIRSGLSDLARFVEGHRIRSIALPPLGSGNGGLDWHEVRPLIEQMLGRLTSVEVFVYEPTDRYQNVAKRDGVQKLTPARALVAELVRRYGVMGLECTLLEVQKLVYLFTRQLSRVPDPFQLQFQADRFGPYAPELRHLLNNLDGSYLHCEKRVADAGPLDTIWFDDTRKNMVSLYLRTEAKQYSSALEATTELIDGFESPLGMEVLGTIDWLLNHDGIPPTAEAVKAGLLGWAGGEQAAKRKLRLFEDQLIVLAIERLHSTETAHA